MRAALGGIVGAMVYWAWYVAMIARHGPRGFPFGPDFALWLIGMGSLCLPVTLLSVIVVRGAANLIPRSARMGLLPLALVSVLASVPIFWLYIGYLLPVVA